MDKEDVVHIYIVWYRLYVESKKNGTNELIYESEIELQIRKQSYGYQGEEGEE